MQGCSKASALAMDLLQSCTILETEPFLNKNARVLNYSSGLCIPYEVICRVWIIVSFHNNKLHGLYIDGRGFRKNTAKQENVILYRCFICPLCKYWSTILVVQHRRTAWTPDIHIFPIRSISSPGGCNGGCCFHKLGKKMSVFRFELITVRTKYIMAIISV